MHRSRLGAIIIDCRSDDLDRDARFWGQALGVAAETGEAPKNPRYRVLETPPEEVAVILQRVEHPSRVHLDIETDDREAEAARLEKLGAKVVARVEGWIVMEAPSGHRFCLIDPQRADFETRANTCD